MQRQTCRNGASARSTGGWKTSPLLLPRVGRASCCSSGRNDAEIRIVDAIDVGSAERVAAAGDEVQGRGPRLRSAIKLPLEPRYGAV